MVGVLFCFDAFSKTLIADNTEGDGVVSVLAFGVRWELLFGVLRSDCRVVSGVVCCRLGISSLDDDLLVKLIVRVEVSGVDGCVFGNGEAGTVDREVTGEEDWVEYLVGVGVEED